MAAVENFDQLVPAGTQDSFGRYQTLPLEFLECPLNHTLLDGLAKKQASEEPLELFCFRS